MTAPRGEGVVWLVWDGRYDPELLAICETKKDALLIAIDQRFAQWQEAFDSSRLFGRRERFQHEGEIVFGHWWDYWPRSDSVVVQKKPLRTHRDGEDSNAVL